MIAAYALVNAKLEKIALKAETAIPPDTIWIDLQNPTIAEERQIEHALSINLPNRAEMDKIEVRSPFYKEGDAHYMTVTAFQIINNQHTDAIALTCVLTEQHLVTTRYAEFFPLTHFGDKVNKISKSLSSEAILGDIIEIILNKCSDILESVGKELDELVSSIFEKTPSKEIVYSSQYNEVIRQIGHIGNIISKNRESLVSISRMLIYFTQVNRMQDATNKDQRMRFKRLAREVYSLGEHANFLSQRNSFLLNASLGMISVEQNMIIKVFTVAAAVFMPPTLIASIYGMNFRYMPELDWWFSYPIILVLIVVSAIIPYLFFKKKNWL